MFTVCQWPVYQNGLKQSSQHVLVIVHIMFHEFRALLVKLSQQKNKFFCPCFCDKRPKRKARQRRSRSLPVKMGIFTLPHRDFFNPSLCHKLSSHTEGQQGNTQNNLQLSRQSHFFGGSDFLADFYERRIWGAKSLGKDGVILSKSVCFFCQPLPKSGI